MQSSLQGFCTHGAGEAPLEHPQTRCPPARLVSACSKHQRITFLWQFGSLSAKWAPKGLPFQFEMLQPHLHVHSSCSCPPQHPEPSTVGRTGEIPGGDGSAGAGEGQEGWEQNPSHVLGNRPVSPCSVCTERATCAGSSPARARCRWTNPRTAW